VRARAVDRLHEQRAEDTRGVRGRAGDGTQHEHDPGQRQADHDSRHGRRRAAGDRAENDEEQDPGCEHLGEERRAPARRRLVEERHAEAGPEARAA
jgi:hypothetical protein